MHDDQLGSSQSKRYCKHHINNRCLALLNYTSMHTYNNSTDSINSIGYINRIRIGDAYEQIRYIKLVMLFCIHQYKALNLYFYIFSYKSLFSVKNNHFSFSMIYHASILDSSKIVIKKNTFVWDRHSSLTLYYLIGTYTCISSEHSLFFISKEI